VVLLLLLLLLLLLMVAESRRAPTPHKGMHSLCCAVGAGIRISSSGTAALCGVLLQF